MECPGRLPYRRSPERPVGRRGEKIFCRIFFLDAISIKRILFLPFLNYSAKWGPAVLSFEF